MAKHDIPPSLHELDIPMTIVLQAKGSGALISQSHPDNCMHLRSKSAWDAHTRGPSFCVSVVNEEAYTEPFAQTDSKI